LFSAGGFYGNVSNFDAKPGEAVQVIEYKGLLVFCRWDFVIRRAAL
jgi:hypothetical protein